MSKQKRCVRYALAFLVVTMLFMSSGCQFGTKIMVSSDPPDKVLEQFFTQLKAGNYKACDAYLANNATFVVTDATEYQFMDTLLEATVQHVSYEMAGKPQYHGLQATQQVSITSLSKEALLVWLKEHINQVEYDYLEQSDKKNVDPENKEDVSGVLSTAIKEYSQNGETVTNTLTVHYVFSEKKWKIQADPDFVTAVFGGVVNEQ